MLSSKDVNFVGYTYKNFEIVNDPDITGIGSLMLLLIIIFPLELPIVMYYNSPSKIFMRSWIEEKKQQIQETFYQVIIW